MTDPCRACDERGQCHAEYNGQPQECHRIAGKAVEREAFEAGYHAAQRTGAIQGDPSFAFAEWSAKR